MRNLWITALLLTLVLQMACSCRALSSFLHDEEAVAKVGNEVLYKSEVIKFIPDGLSEEDSLRLAMQYINSWASDVVFLDIAEAQLSKAEKDVSKELESYRRSLLKYRYEQLYLNERLDTAVTDSEIEAYYQSHKENFVLEVPVVKARYLRISSDSPDLEPIRRRMSSSDIDVMLEAESIASSSADIYTDYGDKWIDITVLARDFGTDYATLLSSVRKSFIVIEDGQNKTHVAYISDFVGAGQIPPVEYCYDRIKDIIISVRKHQLAATLEQELLDDARDKGKFVIY